VLLITHFLFGVVLMKWLKLNPIVLLFCILPDVDNPNTILGRTFKPLSEKLFLRYGHRGLTHSLAFLILVSLSLLRVGFFKEALVGLGSHILLDSLTYMGVKLLFPIRRNYTLFDKTIIVGSKEEKGFIILLLLLLLLQHFL